MKRTILITGGSGLLALNWAILQREYSDIVLCQHKRDIELNGVKSIFVDLGSVDRIVKVISEINPSIIVHAAGLTNVEECERNISLSKQVNILLSKNIAEACLKTGVKLVHISTDHLFDGSKSFVQEEELFNPVNIYGITKADAENEVSRVNSNSLIIRSNFYGFGSSYRRSFSDFIIDNIRNKKTINLFDDIFYTPILIKKLVTIVHALIDKNARGVFNVVGNDRVSKYEFANKLANYFQLDVSLINKVKYIDNPSIVKRPFDMSLSNQKVSNYLGINIGGLDEHLDLLYKQSMEGISGELNKI